MDIASPAAEPAPRTILLPALGTPLPHLGGTLWAIQRGKPGIGQADYALIVPHGPEFEVATPWGSYGVDEPGASCMWDGQANTKALIEGGNEHQAARFCADIEHAGFKDFYLPSLRELKALFANGCDAFDPDAWYWSSTQFSRTYAYFQYFDDGSTSYDLKSWEAGSREGRPQMRP